MSVEPTLVFLNSQALGKPGSIESFFRASMQRKFEVCNIEVKKDTKLVAQWPTYDVQIDNAFEAIYNHRQFSCNIRIASRARFGTPVVADARPEDRRLLPPW